MVDAADRGKASSDLVHGIAHKPKPILHIPLNSPEIGVLSLAGGSAAMALRVPYGWLNDWFSMLNRRIFWVIVVLCAAALNGWLLRDGESQSALAGTSFAVLCLSVSYFLPLERKHVPSLVARHRSRISAGGIPSRSAGQKFATPIVNAFSIDLEDYFHTEVSSRDIDYTQWNKMPSRVESSVHRMLDLLDEHNVQSTVFVLGWVAKRHPQLIREVASRGHEIGCHSYRHRRVNLLTPREFMEDTRMAKETIEDIIGRRIEGYRAPSFSIVPGTEWAFDTLERLGFTYDSSVNPVWHATYANTRAPRFPYFAAGTNVLEIPIATWRFCGVNLPVGGGAYLRLLPYSYIEHGLHAVNRSESRPVTVYVHPWEIDYLQPSIQSGWASHARQQWGTRTMESRLHRLFSTMRFASIGKVYSSRIPARAPAASVVGDRVPLFVRVS